MAKGFFKVPNYVMDDLPDSIDSEAMLVLIGLLRYAKGEMECYPLQQELATALRMSARTLSQKLEILELEGLIQRTRPRNGTGYCYRIALGKHQVEGQ